ncbi:MAG: hypothetical protein HYS41_01485 [Candidatus Omnitrophica bacterium]|nr:hypothetical protein [Candidatus Omnitrophota bacterium]
MTFSVKWAGTFVVASGVSELAALYLLGKSLTVLGWGLRLAWLAWGVAAIREEEGWDRLWRGSVLNQWWKNRKGFLNWISRRS